MNPLVDTLLSKGLLLNFSGILGISLLALTAVRLSRRNYPWAAKLLLVGTLSMLLSRLWYILSPGFVTDDLLYHAGPLGITLMDGLPPLLLNIGLAGVVWGLWGHHRWLQEENRESTTARPNLP